ncbi:MAG: hypothetical protein JNK47_19495 [Mesorhizobium sp.]|nr:hypothetical protein [Mesorhizobium sp.]MBL8579392.1 hypothetical protein [Mesorhizobium sp.]
MGEVFQQVLSIGQSCRERHQARRFFGKNSGRKGVFDWQITPTDALLQYMSRDFSGMLDLADLEVKDGQVTNIRFGTIHPHEFSPTKDIAQQYPKVRANHDRWCAHALSVLTNDRSALFVLSYPVPVETIGEITEAIARLNPRKRFLVLNGPEGDSEAIWVGDDAVWDKHLSHFEIRPTALARAGYLYHRLRNNISRYTGNRGRTARDDL